MCIEIRFFNFQIGFSQKCRFCHQYIRSFFKCIYMFDKVCPQQTLGSIAMYRISKSLRCHESYLIEISFFIKEHKIGCMHRMIRIGINALKLFCGLNSGKMFNFTNNRTPLRGLHSESFSTFCTSCRNNLSTVFTLHSRSKPVCSFSWSIVWLIGSFHPDILIVSLIAASLYISIIHSDT